MKTAYRIIVRKEYIEDKIDMDDLPDMMEDLTPILKNGIVAVYLTEEQYLAQLKDPDVLWRCPITGEFGSFDDGWYESFVCK